MDRQRLTDAEAKKLLERASELDAEHVNSLDLATVRDIASEAGISPAALEAALREKAAEPVATIPAPVSARGIFTPSRIALAFVVAFLVLVFLRRLAG